MSKINHIIPAQNYELIRDRIADILIDEISNQFTLTADPFLKATVTLENSIPTDKTELSQVSVSLDKGMYDQKFQGNRRGVYTYNVDVVTSSKTTNGVSGDTKSTKKLHRLMGVVMAILENPEYKTLGFATPLISNTHVQDIKIAGVDKEDAMNTVMGRVSFSVTATETTSLKDTVLIAGFNTKIKISTTENSYYYIG